jgi:hypothetical protein
MRRRMTLLLSAAALFSVPSAAQASPVTFTETVKDQTQTFTDVLPCRPDLGRYDMTMTFNGVFHVTSGFDLPHASGPLFHVTGTATGRFIAVPQDFSQPTFAGRFTSSFGENANQRNSAVRVISTLRGRGSDGSTIRFHTVVHFSTSASGATITFEKPTCR